LTSLTFASSSSSACFALLIGVFAALAAFSSTFGAGPALGAAALRILGAGFFAATRLRVARTLTLALSRLATLAFFFAARTFFSFFRFCTIRPPPLTA
jgi:hypothetical protein